MLSACDGGFAIPKANKFATLDGLRGAAALTVLLGHLSHSLGVALVPNYYLAVDFFFVLSGFVMASAYAVRLEHELTPFAFMRIRLIRLYPLYLVGTVLFIAYAGARVVFLHDSLLSLPNFCIMSICALLFLPSIVADPERADLYPMNGPAWSLFFELVANLVFALLIRRLTTRLLLGIVVTGFILQTVLAVQAGSLSLGWDRSSFLGGLARVTFSFFCGVAIHRFWSLKKVTLQIPPVVLVFVLIALFALPVTEILQPYFDVTSTLIFPLLTYCGACTEPKSFLRMLCLEGGALSYALYAIHTPIVAIFGSLSTKLLGGPIEVFAPWGGIVTLLAVLALAFALNRFYDGPARQFLTQYIDMMRGKLQALRP